LSYIDSHIEGSVKVKLSLLEQTELIQNITAELVKVVKNGGRIYSCGNGGSACDAMHLAEELVARYLRERPGIRAQHLCDPGAISCWANDYSYEGVFARQVETYLEPRDALIVFSTSGNSENIVQALAAAKKIGASTIGFLGKTGGQAKTLCKFPLIVKSELTAHVQEAHITLVHIICEGLETTLFPK
jgi:D-sedoheptulose 7-phosphate isomerase